ncbi:unnamed protein product [Arabidopsis halleri]
MGFSFSTEEHKKRNNMSNHQTVRYFFSYTQDTLYLNYPWCELKDKVVLVTGASSGIGREVCLDLAKAVCKIIAAAHRCLILKTDVVKFLIETNGFEYSAGIQAAALELDVSCTHHSKSDRCVDQQCGI